RAGSCVPCERPCAPFSSQLSVSPSLPSLLLLVNGRTKTGPGAPPKPRRGAFVGRRSCRGPSSRRPLRRGPGGFTHRLDDVGIVRSLFDLARGGDPADRWVELRTR